VVVKPDNMSGTAALRDGRPASCLMKHHQLGCSSTCQWVALRGGRGILCHGGLDHCCSCKHYDLLCSCSECCLAGQIPLYIVGTCDAFVIACVV
jgi:hypothetical protein